MNSNPGVDYVLSEPSVASTLGSTFSSKIVAGSISSIFSGAWLFGIALCAIATMGVYAYAGIRYENVDSGNKEAEIKEDLKRATYGLIGVLALWLLLNQINPELLRGEIKFNQPTGSATTVPVSTPTTGVIPSGNTNPTTSNNADLQKMLDTEYQIRSQLCGGDGKNCSSNTTGLKINNGACTSIGQSGCTSVGGMDLTTINLLLSLNAGAGEQVMINGGTEWWLHGGKVQDIGANTSKHKPRTRPTGGAVDLRLSPKLDSYIRNIGNSLGQKINTDGYGCSERYTYSSFTFCNETLKGVSTNHWHVE